jgi:DNA-binding CsgD family transcriptional regulator
MTSPSRYARRHEHIITLALAGRKRSQIAEELGMSRQAVSRALGGARKKNLLPPLERAATRVGQAQTRVSRKEEIVELASNGMPPKDIAVRLGCKPSTVHHYLWKARREEGFKGSFKRGATHELGSSTAFLPRPLADALRPEAEQRGLSVPELARAMLLRIVEDDLVSAVLDDGAEEAAHG